ncbi:type 1 glutamine amidotransferase domain-containing protein [Roseomonas gilardii subsp. gilardii]|uniref:type 1 glutamine amidotransferase domain-containing protein n=1 Tax=Roseomonas gilardii TaxID=257708 RepID=UPI001FF8C852|nr:type 1 glutamine amidotransferase domain-containing protein [Roseomonas gilardii]UPG73109.1 type 1 glutamine amidotransferase domain-containing protein [Roseomonas gilardii subsp. gilardii]
MAKGQVLVVATSHGLLGDGPDRTGLWLEELAVPYYALLDAGFEVLLASTAGGEIPIDPRSLPGASPEPNGIHGAVGRFLADEGAMALAHASSRLEDVAEQPHDAIFLPGGHGTMWDLPASRPLATLIGQAMEAGKPVAALCHGPAGLVAAHRKGTSAPVVEGRRVTGFSNREEAATGLSEVLPFLLEDRLRSLGAHYESGPEFTGFALRDGNLITGQNPQSSALVARHLIAALEEHP